MVDAAGGSDAANLLKPALARGELRTIAATTWSEYKQYFEQDAALERRFQMVKVEEPDDAAACLMLRGLKSRYAEHHEVAIRDEAITLFMATIGLTFFIEGAAQLIWGSEVRKLDIGIEDVPIPYLLDRFNIAVSQFDVTSAGICAALVTGLALFFSKTRIGRALRAVADDHQAALAVGIPLQQIWGIVWTVAGFVALVAGLLWGARNGVQFALTFVALKALPVLILGGFTSVPGAIVGGLIIGASEKLAEVYIGPMVGGGIEGWFPYVLALLFLLVRPAGLFGEKTIRRI